MKQEWEIILFHVYREEKEQFETQDTCFKYRSTVIVKIK